MIHPRSVIGCPEPPATRQKLQRVGVLIAHHVGFTPTTRYRSADPERVLADARAVAAYGLSSSRAWEYNYLIGLDGSIFEQGGQFRAAHCLNFNGDSAGVLFMNADGDVENTPAQVEAWWWLRAEMASDRLRILTADHEVAPHYRYRSTTCPGLARAQAPGGLWESPTGQGRLGNLVDALTVAPVVTPPPLPPLPTPTPEGDAMLYIAKPVYPGVDANTPWLAVFESGQVRRAVNADVKYATAAGVPIIDQDSSEQHAYLIAKFGV